MKITIKCFIANLLYKLGFKPQHSWSIADYETIGYGKLDVNGHFDYEITSQLPKE